MFICLLLFFVPLDHVTVIEIKIFNLKAKALFIDNSKIVTDHISLNKISYSCVLQKYISKKIIYYL